MSSTLYIVGTPIGNLKDITLRALETLRVVEAIVCEDTRVTSKLLKAHNIEKPLISLHARSGGKKFEKVLGLLSEGKNLAYITDAGTPGVSDPGPELVRSARGLSDVKVEAIPGPSALTAAFSVAGEPVKDFVFLGFLPHKKGREKIFREIGEEKKAVIFYESPHRIMKTLEALKKVSKKITIARELTKIFEEVLSGSAQELYSIFENNSEKIKGEFTVIISGR